MISLTSNKKSEKYRFKYSDLFLKEIKILTAIDNLGK